MTLTRAALAFTLAFTLALGSAACGDDDAPATDTTLADADDATTGGDADGADEDTATGPTPEQLAILGVAETERRTLPGLSAPVHVVRTDGDTPHIYAATRDDLARVLGFVQARDRFFFMDLQRRLGLGTIAELLGDAGLSQDIESRGTGMAYVTDRLVAEMSPAFASYLTAFADGVNAYIDAVRDGAAEPPSETQFAALLGYDSAADMMKPFALRDVVALVTVFMYSTNFETGDVGLSAAAARLEGLFDGATKEELRKAGYRADAWDDVRPIFPGTSSTDGFGLTGAGPSSSTASAAAASQGSGAASAKRRLPPGLAEHLHAKLEARALRLGKDREAGFGSNMWAVSGEHTADGAALLANDGHLELSVPPLGYGAAIDTRVFGGGDIHQLGGWLGNFPVMVGGTNGDVAWGGVNPVVDITDWYREELQLDDDGLPTHSFFDGAWRPLVANDEDYVVADVPLLESVGRTETWTIWTTFDGRWITAIEGRAVASVEDAADGETVVNVLGDLVVPSDLDDDGVITAISFDHAAFDATRWPEALFEVGLASTVAEVREATRGYVGGALFTSAADRHGDILFTSYQAIPCRDQLGRQGGVFPEGADPTRLLDGTRFGGFELPTDAAGKADEAPGLTDPSRCIVPFDDMPYAINPEAGFIFNANNDPGRITDDGDERNDTWYIGGPWSSVRANTIRRELERLVDAGDVDMEAMIALQADTTSRLGESFAPDLGVAIARADAFSKSAAVLEPHEDRMASLYLAHADAFDAVAARLAAWGERGSLASSGVETFYDAPSADDRADAVATMVFNAWFRRYLALVWNDEGIDAWRWSGSRAQVALLLRMHADRGPDGAMASWDPDTEEAVFFDRLGTDDVERSDELMLVALEQALTWLASEPTGPGAGGFGTEDMDAWLWGLRHQVRFESILAGYIGGDPALALITDMFAITTDMLPLATNFPQGDPRVGLKWFPRGGDQWGVDAANPGLGGDRYTYGSGPAMRLVFALKDGAVEGRFILPGGQSGRVASPHFADQARLWLANDYYPVRFKPADVATGALGREVYEPPAP